MRRRTFISLIGGAAVMWPLPVAAQQPQLPLIGYLHGGSSEPRAPMIAAFRQGLAEAGWVDGQNVAIAFQWAEGHNERLPTLSA